MARKTNKPVKGKPIRIHVVLPGDLIIKVDAMRAELAVPGSTVTRTDVVRRAIYSFVDRR